MNKQKIILVGGGGHCKACIDVIEAENKFQIEGILDLPNKLGEQVLDYKIIGNDNDIAKYAKKGFSFLLTVGHIGDEKLRQKLFDEIKKEKGELPSIISSNAYVSTYSEIETGTIIMHQAIVNANSKIGENCIINNKALVEHDCNIGNNSHISTNAVVNGTCNIGNNCFIGSSSVIKNNTNICDKVIIGAGSVVTKDIIEAGVYVGSPAKRIK